MKKLISTVAALAIVFTMGVSALADGLPSPTSGTKITGTTDASGIEVVVDDTTLTSDQQKTIDAAVTAAAGANAEVANIDVCDVWIKDTTSQQNVSKTYTGYPLTVVFSFDDAANVVAVLYWNDTTGKWDEAKFSIKDGKVEVTFDHLCNVAFVIKKGSQSGSPSSSSSSGKSSAQTGYDGLVYIVSAIVLASGAVFFFSTANKQKTVKEVM